MTNVVVLRQGIGALVLMCSAATTALVAQQAAAARSPHPDPSLSADPTADEVMERAVEAAGGRQAIDRIKTLRTIMAVSVQGIDLHIETCWSRDGGRVYKTAHPMGEMLMVSDGKVAWTNTPGGGYTLLNDEQKQNLDQQASMVMHMLDPKLHMADSMKSIENAGKQAFAGKECWRLHYVRNDGKEGDVFLDVSSGLPVGFESLMTQQGKEVRMRGVVGEWKPESDVQFYRQFRMETSQQGAQPMDMKVTKVEVNTIDPAVFAAPKEVVALAAKLPPTTSTAPAKEISLDDMTPQQRETAIRALEGFKKTGDVNSMKRILQRVQSVVEMIPENDRLPMEYAVQELRKEIAKLGG